MTWIILWSVLMKNCYIFMKNLFCHKFLCLIDLKGYHSYNIKIGEDLAKTKLLIGILIFPQLKGC